MYICNFFYRKINIGQLTSLKKIIITCQCSGYCVMPYTTHNKILLKLYYKCIPFLSPFLSARTSLKFLTNNSAIPFPMQKSALTQCAKLDSFEQEVNRSPSTSS